MRNVLWNSQAITDAQADLFPFEYLILFIHKRRVHSYSDRPIFHSFICFILLFWTLRERIKKRRN